MVSCVVLCVVVLRWTRWRRVTHTHTPAAGRKLRFPPPSLLPFPSVFVPSPSLHLDLSISRSLSLSLSLCPFFFRGVTTHWRHKLSESVCNTL